MELFTFTKRYRRVTNCSDYEYIRCDFLIYSFIIFHIIFHIIFYYIIVHYFTDIKTILL